MMSRTLRGLVLTASLVAMVALPSAALGADGRTPQVIGGTASSTSAWPFSVALLRASEERSTRAFYCGGTLIGPDTVLTAAHCAFGLGPGDIDVVIGRSRLSSPAGERIPVRQVSWHPGFDFNLLHNDVAILRLERPVAVTPVPLVPAGLEDRWAVGRHGVVLGWGATYSSDLGQTLPDVMRRGSVTFLDDASCAEGLGRLWDGTSQVCATTTDGQNICSGDSGGPLLAYDGVDTWYQVGVASYAYRCASTTSPAGFARIVSLAGWITSSPPPAPTVSTLRVGGTGAVGSPLACVAEVSAGASVEYRWTRNFSVIPDETSPTYVPKDSDVGTFIDCEITVRSAGGWLPASSEGGKAISEEGLPPADRKPPKTRGLGIVCEQRVGRTGKRCFIEVATIDESAVTEVQVVLEGVVAATGRRITRWYDLGTRNGQLWRSRIRKLPVGRYELVARAVDEHGNARPRATSRRTLRLLKPIR